MREVAVGFLRSKLMDRGELDSVRKSLSGIPVELKKVFISKFEWNKGNVKKDSSRRYGFLRSNIIQFMDVVCAFDDEAWVIELKGELDHKALGQVLVYKELFFDDYPEYSNVKMGIVCDESSPLIEPVCKKFSVEVFERGESFRL